MNVCYKLYSINSSYSTHDSNMTMSLEGFVQWGCGYTGYCYDLWTLFSGENFTWTFFFVFFHFFLFALWFYFSVWNLLFLVAFEWIHQSFSVVHGIMDSTLDCILLAVITYFTQMSNLYTLPALKGFTRRNVLCGRILYYIMDIIS